MTDYCTIALVKTRLGITNTDDDTMLQDIVSEVSAWMDAYCNRPLYRDSDETRYYDPLNDVFGTLLVFDGELAVVTSVTVGGTLWASSDYITQPRNRPPYREMRLARASSKTWSDGSVTESSIVIVGRWCMIPSELDSRYDLLQGAAVALAMFVYREKDAGNNGDIVGILDAGLMMVDKGFPSGVAKRLQGWRRHGVAT